MLVRLNICLEYLKPNIKTISNSSSLCVQQFWTIIKHLSRKWIFDDKNVFIVCDVEGKLNEWIKLFKNTLKGCKTLFIIDDHSAESEMR